MRFDMKIKKWWIGTEIAWFILFIISLIGRLLGYIDFKEPLGRFLISMVFLLLGAAIAFSIAWRVEDD